MITMGKRAFVLELALAEEFPVPAHFGLVFDLVGPYKVFSFFVGVKDLLWLLECSFLEIAILGFFLEFLFLVALLMPMKTIVMLLCGLVKTIFDYLMVLASTK
jgi:hypothetical protein